MFVANNAVSTTILSSSSSRTHLTHIEEPANIDKLLKYQTTQIDNVIPLSISDESSTTTKRTDWRNIYVISAVSFTFSISLSVFMSTGWPYLQLVYDFTVFFQLLLCKYCKRQSFESKWGTFLEKIDRFL